MLADRGPCIHCQVSMSECVDQLVGVCCRRCEHGPAEGRGLSDEQHDHSEHPDGCDCQNLAGDCCPECHAPTVVRTVVLRDPGLPTARLFLMSDGSLRWEDAV